MSQLVVRPGRNAAREAKRIKEIRKVKAAIQWHERERKKRHEIARERAVTKVTFQKQIQEKAEVRAGRRKALANAREDWRLGPLRPNRAVGEAAKNYGIQTQEDVSRGTDIIVEVQRSRNERREKKGLEPEYPLIVDDKKYFHIVKGDRVVILRGKGQHQIGEVSHIHEKTHQVTVKGVNTQYFDASLFTYGETKQTVQESEVAIPFDDIRLVIPAELTQREALHKEEVKVYRDVIVDKIRMERHITGIDPFTGTDYGDAEIPKEHQYDPQTGAPIFQRYIAGTQHRIEWPWEHERFSEKKDIGLTIGNVGDRHNWLKKALGTIRHPIAGLQRWRNKGKETAPVKAKQKSNLPERIKTIEQRGLEKLKTDRPKSMSDFAPVVHDFIDTTRDIVEGTQSMSYTLLYPPLPRELNNELLGNTRDMIVQARKDNDPPLSSVKVKRTTRAGAVARELAKQQKRAAEMMKTPMQLRWETEHARKVQQRKKNPLVNQDALLLALGQHMQKNGFRMPQSRAASKMEELD